LATSISLAMTPFNQSTPEYLLAKSEECLAQALNMHDPDARNFMVKVAAMYRRMAAFRSKRPGFERVTERESVGHFEARQA